jgi:thiol-disulfide isomerase/thioredoxin
MLRRFLLIISFAFVVLTPRAVSGQDQSSNTLKIGDSRPELNFKLLNGRSGPTWAELEGKVAVIDFWASWCGPCIKSFPMLNELQKKFRGMPVEFYSITYEPQNKIAGLLREHPLRTKVGIDNDLATFKSFRAWGVPSVYIFDRKGKVVAAILVEDLTEAVVKDALAGRIPNVKQTTGWKDPKGAEQ